MQPTETPKLHDHAAERGILSVLLDVSAVTGPDRARLLLERERLVADDFHEPACAAAFGAGAALLHRGEPMEPGALWNALRSNAAVTKAGGAKWLVELAMSGPNVLEHSLPGYARRVRDMALRRRMYLAAKDLQAKCFDVGGDAGEVLAKSLSGLSALTRRNAQTKTLREHITSMLDELDAIRQGTKEPVLRTGIDALDEAIGGLQRTLTVVGAGPGVGKSALLATIARNLAQRGVKVGVFSLEDAGEWMAWRMVSHESGVTQFVMRNRRLNQEQYTSINDGCERVWDYGEHVHIDDRSALSPQDVVATARDWVLNRGVQVVIVDHLGELRHNSGRRERFDLDVAEGLSDLRSIAKQYGVPVVCACHLNRKADDAEEIRLSHFANSAAIERQARVALGLTREPGSGELVVWVLKQTNGKAGLKVLLDFHGPAAMVRNEGGRVLGEEPQRNEHE